MSKENITTLNTKSVFETDMAEKYHVGNLGTRNPLAIFRDANVISGITRNGINGSSDNTSKYLSPNIANLTKSMTDVTTFSDFMDIVGIDQRKLADNLNRMDRNKKDVVFIGYGGMTINVLNFMRNMCQLHYDTNIINHLSIYEPDKLSLTNLFRVYKDCSKIVGDVQEPVSKLNLFNEHRLAMDSDFKTRYFTQDELRRWSKDTIFIGAPDFATRELLKDSHFLFVGHSDNEVSITYQPSTEHDMTIETYGKIDVRILWANLLHATNALVEILGKDEFYTYEPNTELFKFNAYELGNRPQRATRQDTPHSF